MSSLTLFPNPPAPTLFTICEKNSDLVTIQCGNAPAQEALAYPDLNVSAELRKCYRSSETARSAFLEHDDSARTRLLEAWYEHGLSGVLEELTSRRQPQRNRFIMWMLRQSLWFVRMANNFHSSLFPHLSMSNDRLIEKFSTTADWSNSVVRCFVWHPHAPKFAVALHDDSVCIHQAQPSDIVPVLKHKMQLSVADIAWKPTSASVLAVACQSCILIWTIEPTSLATRPSASCAQVLSTPGHSPVISVAWCPLDGILVSASPTDSAIMVWVPSMDTYVAVKRVGHGGVTLLRWSPQGSKLFTGCPSATFRVWRCEDWTPEMWTTSHGRCQAACWSSDDTVLLFATANEPVIYMILFDEGNMSVTANIGAIRRAQSAMPVIDLTPVDRQLEDLSTVQVGGLVQAMAWDQHDERLAVLCQGSSATFVILFQTRLRPTFELLPCGFIRGLPQELAVSITFKQNFDEGSLLTVVWSSGRIAHIPLYYVPRTLIGRSQDAPFVKQLPASASLFTT